MKKYLLETVVFISGAAVMIFELAGSRMFAPYLGTSLVVWTALIGVILGSLSLGYWYGGRLADKRPQSKVLALILLASAFFVGLTVFLQSIVLSFFSSFSDLRASSLLAAFILFAPASILFGMVSPYAIKLKLENLEKSGATIGSMYAVSTIGSIIGTFSGGFLLIPFFGTVKIIFIITFVLVATAVLVLVVNKDGFKKRDIFLLVLFFSIMLFGSVQAAPESGFLVNIDTKYNRVLIFEQLDPQTNRPIRLYTTGPNGAQSAVFLDQDDDLVFDYLKFYRLSEHFNPEIRKALMIGGGAYTYPRDFLRQNPEATIDVVEIDEELERIARKYFNFQDDERIKIINEDGRIFLNKNQTKYDVVFLDAFTSRFSTPFQLTTKEALQGLYNSLADQGVVLANFISAITGDKGKFLRAEIATFKSVFPQVYIFPVTAGRASQENQNILLVALKSEKAPDFINDDPELNKYLSRLWQKEIDQDLPVLTDDYAPVDYYRTLVDSN